MSDNIAHSYEDKFFDYLDVGARRSAQPIVALLREYLRVSNFLDVGCGRGVWVDEWLRNGVTDAVGADGEYIRLDRLVIDKEKFVALDLSRGFRLGRRFDLVQSLEVAEHIPAAHADVFLDNLVAHGDLVLFSAAVPGQGGEFHVNEQPYEYWRGKFASRGFELFDFIRPNILNNQTIEPWYRYNTFLFVHQRALDRIPEEISQTRLRHDQPVVDLSPLAWRLRNSVVRRLPRWVVQRIARLKHVAVRSGLSLR
ncbi:MAG TPA: methyltransferase domain-containing protein [Chthoniobacterales bacterium]